jgi:nucleotide-binding universal stress UspA family protein
MARKNPQKSRRIAIWAVDAFERDPELLLKALRVATDWSERTGSKIRPVYVLSPYELNLSEEATGPSISEYAPNARKVLDQLVAQVPSPLLLAPEIIIEHSASITRTADALSNYALQSGAEAILITSHGRKGLRRLILGSFAETLLLRSKVPVLTLGPKADRISHLDHILFSTDFDASSKPALRHVTYLAKRLGARLTLFHSVPRPIEPVFQSGVYLLGGSWVPVQAYFSAEAERVERRAASWCHWSRRQGVETEYLIDNAGNFITQAVLRAAKNLRCGIIALEARSGRLAAALVGSVTREVIRQSSLPVWIVRQDMAQPESRAAAGAKPLFRRAA